MIQINTVLNRATCTCDYCNKKLEIKEVDIPSIEDKLKSKNWNIEIRLGLDYLICPICQRQNRYLQ